MPFLNSKNNPAFSFIDNNTLEQNELQGDSHFQGFRKTHVSDFRICTKTGFWSLWNFVGFWIYRSLANRLELKGTYSVHIPILFSSNSYKYFINHSYYCVFSAFI